MSSSYASSSDHPSILSSVSSKKNEPVTCEHIKSPSIHNISDSSSEFACPPAEEEPEVDYEKYKTILKEPSLRSGENLFDHLVNIIKAIIDGRPRNVTDYFEQFSRKVRQMKLSSSESIAEPQFLELAKSLIEFLKSLDLAESISCLEEFEDNADSEMTVYQSSDSTNVNLQRRVLDNENVLQSLSMFSFCGLGFYIDEVFQLSLSAQKVQLHQHVSNARFWGRIYGLNGSYYIVEASLTPSETENRVRAMKRRLLEDMVSFKENKERFGTLDSSDMQLFPGSRWQHLPEEDLKKMQHPTEPIPKLCFSEIFHGPEEPVGTGLNRKTYFVTTSLSQEWQELPTVAPRHIKASKKIKKYFTGNLDVDLQPIFPGSEKHYLRAVIARITAGTFIAPNGFYRRMTRKERKTMEDSQEVEEEEFELDEEDDFDNDALITQNEGYIQHSLEELTLDRNWVHIRPYILSQGRALYINEELAIRDLDKRATLMMQGGVMKSEDLGEDEFEGEDLQEEEAEDKEEDSNNLVEIGPNLFESCSEDRNNEGIPSWTSRYSSVYNTTNQMILMRSNLWPGAYSIAMEDISDCIYIGWGFKYVARCTSLEELPIIKDVDFIDDAEETTDPTVDMENRWCQYHMKKKSLSLNGDEEMSDISVEVDFDDED